MYVVCLAPKCTFAEEVTTIEESNIKEDAHMRINSGHKAYSYKLRWNGGEPEGSSSISEDNIA